MDELRPLFQQPVFSVAVVSDPTGEDSNLPELQRPSMVELEVVQPQEDGLELGKCSAHPPDEIWRALYTLEQIKLPIVGWGLFEHGWRVLAAKVDVSAVIPLTIDVHDFVLRFRREKVAEGSWPSDLPVNASTFEKLVEANCAGMSPDRFSGIEIHGAACLWYRMVIDEQLIIGESKFPLSTKELRVLTGETRRFSTASEWAARLIDRGSINSAPTQAFEPIMRERYSPYLEAREAPPRLDEADFHPRTA